MFDSTLGRLWSRAGKAGAFRCSQGDTDRKGCPRSHLYLGGRENELPDASAPQNTTRCTPRLWALLGHKAGENSQVLALAEALGWPFESKNFSYKWYGPAVNLMRCPTLAGIVKERSSILESPWPDLIITAGWSNEPVARWIRRLAAADGHRVRITHLGRTWAKIEHFDLIITTPQYRLPVRYNVLHNKMPLNRITSERLKNDARRWQCRLDHLPGPLITVVIGGSSGPYTFDPIAARRLARQASTLAAARGGSLLVTTSSRTPAPTIDILCAEVSVPAFVYRWSKGDAGNPYFAFLGLASEIVVTGDSISMLAEACATRKPVHIFDVGEGENAMRPKCGKAHRTDRNWLQRWTHAEAAHIRAFGYRQMMRFGPPRLSRDICLVHGHLTDSGRAVWLGDPFPHDRRPPALEWRSRAVSRVQGLFDFTLGGGTASMKAGNFSRLAHHSF